jgi:putative ABC transport system substrate-binding protein
VLGALGAGLALPRIAFAQAARVPTIAVLFIGESEEDEPAARPYFDEMARLGWVEGRTVNYDRHSGKGMRQYVDTMVSRAAGSEPDLVFATTGSIAAAVVKESRALPVVFTSVIDPVAAGVVTSLDQPGGNATGIYQVQVAAAPRRFALVRQAMPELKRMGAMFDRASPEYQSRAAAHVKAARAVGIELVTQEFTNFEVIEKSFAQFRRERLRAVEMTPSFLLTGRRREVVALAERNELALVAHRSEWADAGAILSYGADLGEAYRRAAGMTHRILKGASPGSIAVERPTRNELVVNPRAALALGITLPKALLQQANRVVA